MTPQSKMHPQIASLVSGKPLPADARFVRNGKAEVQVWLTSLSNEALEALKQAGFEILRPASSVNLTMVIGRIRVDKLNALAGLAVVRYIAPLEDAKTR